MSRTAVLAWGTFGLSLGAMVAALVVWAAATGESLTPDIVLYPAAYIAFGAVGALIASRHPTNRIAALFGPARSRVRAIVNRRFYRSRYDAQRTLAQFGGQMRDQVDLDSVGRTLAATAATAVRPASIGLWIRAS